MLLCVALLAYGFSSGWLGSSQKERRLLVRFPAAERDGNGHLANIEVTYLPTDGPLKLLTPQQTYGSGIGPEMSLNLWNAVYLAHNTADLPLLGAQWTVEVPSGAAVDGPSAGALVAGMMLVLLKGRQDQVRQDVTMTGKVYPDGTTGVVGMVPQKMAAAKRHGIKRFGVPWGMEVDEQVRKAGEQLGLQVVAVKDIRDAYRELTGEALAVPRGEVEDADLQPSLECESRLREATSNMAGQIAALYRSLPAEEELSEEAMHTVSTFTGVLEDKRFTDLMKEHPVFAYEKSRRIVAQLHGIHQGLALRNGPQLPFDTAAVSAKLTILDDPGREQSRVGQDLGRLALYFDRYEVAGTLAKAEGYWELAQQASGAEAARLRYLAGEHLGFAEGYLKHQLDFSDIDREQIVPTVSGMKRHVSLTLQRQLEHGVHYWAGQRPKNRRELASDLNLANSFAGVWLAVEDPRWYDSTKRLVSALWGHLVNTELLLRREVPTAKVRHFNDRLDKAARNVRELAYRTQQSLGFIPAPTRYSYALASCSRHSMQEEDLYTALRSYWVAATWCELALQFSGNTRKPLKPPVALKPTPLPRDTPAESVAPDSTEATVVPPTSPEEPAPPGEPDSEPHSAPEPTATATPEPTATAAPEPTATSTLEATSAGPALLTEWLGTWEGKTALPARGERWFSFTLDSEPGGEVSALLAENEGPCQVALRLLQADEESFEFTAQPSEHCFSAGRWVLTVDEQSQLMRLDFLHAEDSGYPGDHQLPLRRVGR